MNSEPESAPAPVASRSALRARVEAIRARDAEQARQEAEAAGAVGSGIADVIAELRARAEARQTAGAGSLPAWPCPQSPYLVGEPIAPGVEVCDRAGHYIADPDGGTVVIRDCPFVAVMAERKRLAGLLAKLARGGGEGFDGYDPRRHPSAAKALAAMRAFASARPPREGVLLIGEMGLGKTRLLVASHLALLAAGLRSRYLTTPELRALFRAANSYDGDARLEAERTLAAIRRAHAVHLDDLGDVEGDERKRGEFSEGLKALRDLSTGAWAVAMNCDAEEAATHPDIGRKVLDRFIDGSVVVPMKGESQRRPVGASR